MSNCYLHAPFAFWNVMKGNRLFSFCIISQFSLRSALFKFILYIMKKTFKESLVIDIIKKSYIYQRAALPLQTD